MKWATKSLVIGALATLVDLAIGTFCAVVLHLPTRACTAAGLVVGATLNYLAQRRFAFADGDTRLAQTFVRWALVTAAQIAVHGQLVTMLRDGLHVPYVPAKLLGDVVVFTVLQLVLLRYVVFPRRKGAAGAAGVGSAAPHARLGAVGVRTQEGHEGAAAPRAL